jgi:hypothetical protein
MNKLLDKRLDHLESRLAAEVARRNPPPAMDPRVAAALIDLGLRAGRGSPLVGPGRGPGLAAMERACALVDRAGARTAEAQLEVIEAERDKYPPFDRGTA